MDKSTLEYLEFQFKNARVVLFTGAGFSLDTKDLDGKPLPTGAALARELWELCFPGDPYEDGNSLQDLFHIALAKHRSRLTALLQRRFTITPNSLPEYYRIWFSMPWMRAYTLNVDDLELAVARRFELPRRYRPVGGLLRNIANEANGYDGSSCDVIHLNGMMIDGPEGVTFSTTQYAERLAGQEPWYARMVADVITHPVIFVGTPLDEPLLWQHIEHRGTKGKRGLSELRPRSFLVSPFLSRARQGLLQEFNVQWIKMTAEEFAAQVLETLSHTTVPGLAALGALAHAVKSTPDNIVDVADVVSRAAASRTAASFFLIGEEPEWQDIQTGRAIERSVDGELFDSAERLIRSRSSAKSSPDPSASVLVVTGTAGSGKSTGLMRLALRLVANGRNVAWIDRDAELDPRDIRTFCRKLTQDTVLAIDNADRYGAEMANILLDAIEFDHVVLIVVAVRSSKVDRVLNPTRLQQVERVEVAMPHLTDVDIGALIDVLARENRLGKLKGKSRVAQEQALREKCGRQLLVAMIEATSGEKFETKVVEEWRELPDEGRELYALIAVATSLRYALSREDILVACGDQSNLMLNALDTLTKRHVVATTASGRLRARHKVIAEFLIEELHSHGNNLASVYAKLAFMAASQVSQLEHRSSHGWRFVKAVLNHDYLQRMIGVEGARFVYETVEHMLDWDFHYWLQRGSLEVEHSNIRLAENFLEQAKSLNPTDPFVVTEHAYMQIRKAIEDPASVSAPKYVADAIVELRDQISARGRTDSYPYHILGSQALAWSRRAPMSKEDRKLFLKPILTDVEEGMRRHPGSRDLAELARDLQKEVIALSAGLP